MPGWQFLIDGLNSLPVRQEDRWIDVLLPTAHRSKVEIGSLIAVSNCCVMGK